jgi:hypothetical protein
MKRSLLLTIVMLTLLSMASARNNNPVTILSASSSMLYLKFSKYMMGAQIEVRDEKNNLVSHLTVNERKMIIDFYYEIPGKYVITITKDDLMERFSYVTADENGDGESVKITPSILPSLTYRSFFLRSEETMLC